VFDPLGVSNSSNSDVPGQQLQVRDVTIRYAASRVVRGGDEEVVDQTRKEIETASNRFGEGIRMVDVGDPLVFELRTGAAYCTGLMRSGRRGGSVHDPT